MHESTWRDDNVWWKFNKHQEENEDFNLCITTKKVTSHTKQLIEHLESVYTQQLWQQIIRNFINRFTFPGLLNGQPTMPKAQQFNQLPV